MLNASTQTFPFRPATEKDIIGSWYRVSGSNLQKNESDNSNKTYKRIFFNEDGTTKEWVGYGDDPQKIDKEFPGLLDLPVNTARYTVKNGNILIEKGQNKKLLGSIFFENDLTDPKHIEQFRSIGTPKKGDLILINPATGESDLMRRMAK